MLGPYHHLFQWLWITLFAKVDIINVFPVSSDYIATIYLVHTSWTSLFLSKWCRHFQKRGSPPQLLKPSSQQSVPKSPERNRLLTKKTNVGIQILPQLIYWIVYVFIYNTPRERPFPFSRSPCSTNYPGFWGWVIWLLSSHHFSFLFLQQSVDTEGS